MGPYVLYKSTWVGNDFFLHQRIIFLTIWGKTLTVAGVLRKNILVSLPIPKIKFDPPPQWNIALVFIS